MAKPEVVADVGRTLSFLLTQGLSGIVEPGNVRLMTPDEMKTFTPSKPSVTIFLYNVSINAELRNGSPVSLADGTARRPPLPLDLRYLITPWAKDTLDSHKVVGHVVQCLYDNASLARPDLQGDSWAPDDTLQLVLESLPIEEHTDIWDPTDIPYRLSLAYLARVVALDSGRTRDAPAVISARFGGP